MPVYNDEKYIEEAIESIIKQTLDGIEIICVNDGSSDNSLKILKDYEKKYDYIKVFSQENQGVSVARNKAMNIATGEYFAFLDSDDIFVEDDALEKLYKVAKEKSANLVAGNLIILNVDGSFSDFTLLKYYDKYEEILPENYGSPYSFTKAIFKRDFLLLNNIYFPLLTKGEDPAFMAEVLSKVDMIYAVPTDVYAYRYIDGSAKYHSYKNYYDQVKHYKLGLDHLSHPKFAKTKEDFRFQIFKFIDYMNVKGARQTIRAIQEVFHDDYDLLRKCEEYFYYKYKNYPELQKLVSVKQYEDKPRISVLISVYNDSRFITHCLNNLINQSLTDFEVICVNEQSTDKSLDILKKFSNKDSRIKYVSNDNGGCGSARNKALADAKGDYILFLNSRDLLINDALERLYVQAEVNESDVVLFKSYDFIKNESKEKYVNLLNMEFFKSHDYHRFTFDYSDIKKYLFNNNVVLPNEKLFKRSFIQKHEELYFPANVEYLKSALDILSIMYAEKITYLADNLYQLTFDHYDYLIPMGSFELNNIISYIESCLKDANLFEEVKDEFNNYKLYYLFNSITTDDSEEKFRYLKEECESMDINDSKIDSSIKGHFSNFSSSNTVSEYHTREEYEKNINSNEELLHKRQKLNEEKNNFINSGKTIENENNKIYKNYLNLEKTFKFENKKNEILNVKYLAIISDKDKLNNQKNQLKSKNKELLDEVSKLKREVDEISNSKSWNLTQPLRNIKRKFFN